MIPNLYRQPITSVATNEYISYVLVRHSHNGTNEIFGAALAEPHR